MRVPLAPTEVYPFLGHSSKAIASVLSCHQLSTSARPPIILTSWRSCSQQMEPGYANENIQLGHEKRGRKKGGMEGVSETERKGAREQGETRQERQGREGWKRERGGRERGKRKGGGREEVLTKPSRSSCAQPSNSGPSSIEKISLCRSSVEKSLPSFLANMSRSVASKSR